MITIKKIKEELEARGYNIVEQHVIKNGVSFNGLMWKSGSDINPVVYPELILNGLDKNDDDILDEIVEYIIEMFKKACPFNLDILKDKEKFLSLVRVGIQKTSSAEIIKRESEYKGLEEYPFLFYKHDIGGDDESYMTAFIIPALLKEIGITEEEVWKAAEKNTIETTSIVDMRDFVEAMLKKHYNITDMPELPINKNGMFIITNQEAHKGAGAIINKAVIAELAKSKKIRTIIIIPSSINEMLLVPYTGDITLEEFTEMVTEINATVVDPKERLTDSVYTAIFPIDDSEE